MKRTILVSGGNRGIGNAIVKELSKSDDQIILGCRRPNEIEDKLSDNIKIERLDLSNNESLQTSCQELKEKYKHIDCIINNAGVLIEDKYTDLTIDEFDYVYHVNVRSPYFISKFFLQGMIENNYGRIVNISSGWGSFSDGLTGPFSYSFSKAALNALTLTASKSLPKNIKINSMCPGWVKTRMGGEAAPRTPEQGAETAIWLVNADESSPTGKFFRDKKEIDW